MNLTKLAKRIASLSKIDLGSLEEEWVNHEHLVGQCARFVADAKKAVNDAEAELELASAEAKNHVRRHPTKYGLPEGKVTDGATKDLYVKNGRYQTALATLNETKHTVDLLNGVMNRLSHRKTSLENLVALHGQSYFAKPRIPKGVDNTEIARSIEAKTKKKNRPKGFKI